MLLSEVRGHIVHAVRLAIPSLNCVVQANQTTAAAPRPVEPYAAVALEPLGPTGHPVISYPERGVSAPSPIAQVTEHRYRALCGVSVFGSEAADMAMELDYAIHSDVVNAYLISRGIVLHTTPADVQDVSALRDDAWQGGVIRLYGVSWIHAVESPIYPIESVAVPTVATTGEDES